MPDLIAHYFPSCRPRRASAFTAATGNKNVNPDDCKGGCVTAMRLFAKLLIYLDTSTETNKSLDVLQSSVRRHLNRLVTYQRRSCEADNFEVAVVEPLWFEVGHV